MKNYRSASILLFLMSFLCLEGKSQNTYFPDVPPKVTDLYENARFTDAVREISKNKDFHQSPSLLNFAGWCLLNNYQPDSAALYYKKSVDLVEKQSGAASPQGASLQALVDAKLGLIDCYLNSFSLEAATTVFEEVKAITDSTSIDQNAPEILLRKADISYFNDYAKTRGYLESLLETLPVDHPLRNSLHISYIDILLDDKYSTKVDSVINGSILHTRKYYQNDPSKLGRMLIIKALNKNYQGNYYAAIDILDNEVKPLLVENQEHWANYLRSEYYRIIAICYHNLQDFIKVKEYLTAFQEIAPSIYDQSHYRIAESYDWLSRLYLRLGRTELSMNYLDESIRLYEKQAYKGNYLISLQKKGQRAYDNGQLKEAIDIFNQLLKIEVVNKQFEAIKQNVIYKLSSCYLLTEQYDKAWNEIQKLSEVESYARATPYMTLKWRILRKLDKKPLEEKVLSRLIAQIDTSNLRSDFNKMVFVLQYSPILINEGQPEEALRYLRKVMHYNPIDYISTRIETSPEFCRHIVRVLARKGKAFEELYNRSNEKAMLDSAYSNYSSSIKLLNQIKKQYKSPADRIQNVDQLRDIYHAMVRICYQLSKEETSQEYKGIAFNFVESYLSNQLLEELNRNLDIQQTNVPDSILLQLNNLKQQATYLKSTISDIEKLKVIGRKDSMRLKDFRFASLRNKEKHNNLIRLLEKEYTNYYDANYKEKLTGLREVGQSLEASEALIEYLVTEDNVYAFCITSSESFFLRLKKPSEELIQTLLTSLYEEERGLPSEEAYKAFPGTSARLYDLLLSEILELPAMNSITRLTLVTDNYLSYIPFEILISDQDSANSAQTPAYLIHKYEISYAYSSSIKTNQALYEGSEGSGVLAFAPSYSNTSGRAAIYRSEDWSELLFNEKEVENISKHYPTKTITNEAASERSFLQQYADYSILHLAMHAKVNLQNPQRSKLIFTPTGDSIYDGSLHSFELYNMKINNRLTVLSACNTGSGELVNGEGIMSLARAFTYAGSKSVVMSHWQVDDQSTNFLMNAFYQYLAEGRTKSAALRLAKLDYLAQAGPNKQHPFFWSAFVMIGDDAPIPTADKQYWQYLVIGIILLLALTALIWFIRKKKN